MSKRAITQCDGCGQDVTNHARARVVFVSISPQNQEEGYRELDFCQSCGNRIAAVLKDVTRQVGA
jgi:hypothetical protein